MKKIVSFISCFALTVSFIACNNTGKTTVNNTDDSSVVTEETTGKPQYTVLEKPQVDLSQFPVDKDGYITLFDGKTLNGWRGYGRDDVPARWVVDNGTLKFIGTGGGEAQEQDGGDLIFAHKFKNFELDFEYKVAKGSNSGVFFLAQEIQTKDAATGELQMEPIYISAPEAQVLDNENHIDARMGKNNNRQAMSLYDMIPAVPQNAKPFGEWNKASITVSKGNVVHGQNGENVVEYQLWTPEWIEMIDNSKFSKESWPLAYELLTNVGGPNREGYIGLQDHGDDVWFRNIRIKILD